MTDSQSIYKRTEVYEKKAAEPKFLFVKLANQLKHMFAEQKLSELSGLDIGGASGDLAGFLQDTLAPKKQVLLEYDKELVALAQQNYPELSAIQGDAEQLPSQWKDSFDYTTMVGVLSIFDDFTIAVNQAIEVTKEQGTLIIVGQFNPFPVDALIQWRYSDKAREPWNKGYNLFSEQSVANFLDEHEKVASFAFEKFMVPFDISPQADPIRTWTELDGQGEKIFRNGIMPIPLSFLTISLQ